MLLHKKGSRDDLKNWRPIAMGDYVAKLFAAVLADRLTRWVIANNRLNAAQKGFLPHEGCLDHSIMLHRILESARTRKNEVVVAWLDLADAFGSVPHTVIRRARDSHRYRGQPLSRLHGVRSDSGWVHGSHSHAVGITAGLFLEPDTLRSGVRPPGA